MVGEVALDLHPEELGGDHHPVLAVPLADAVLGGVGGERATLVLVEPDRQGQIGHARLDGVRRSKQRRATGGATVVHAHERRTGEPELFHERIGMTAVLAATSGEVDIGPLDTRIAERASGGDQRHLSCGDVEPTERMQTNSNDCDIHYCISLIGSNQKLNGLTFSSMTTRTASPIFQPSIGLPRRRDSILTGPRST